MLPAAALFWLWPGDEQPPQVGQAGDAAHAPEAEVDKPSPGLLRLQRKAATLTAERKFSEAIKAFRHLLRLRPQCEDSHRDLALALAAGGEVAEAVEVYRRAQRRWPDSADLVNNLAWLLVTCDDDTVRCPRDGVRLVENYLKRTATDDPDLLDTLAAGYAECGRFEEAVIAGEKAVELADDAGAGQLASEIAQRLLLYRSERSYGVSPTPAGRDKTWRLSPAAVEREAQRAIEEYVEALDEQPQAAEAFNVLAWILATYDDQRVRDPEAAMQLAEAVCRASEEPDPRYLDTLAAAHAASGRWEDARRTLDRASDGARFDTPEIVVEGIRARRELYRARLPFRDPATLDDADINGPALAHRLWAQVLRSAGRENEALAALRQAVRFDPRDAPSHAALGDMLLARKLFRRAATHLRAALSILPDDADAHRKLAVALLELGQAGESIGHLQHASRLRPDDESIARDLGLALVVGGRRDEAHAHYHAALVRWPESDELANNFAWLLATGGRFGPDEALQAVRLMNAACRRNDGRDPEHLDTLAAAYAAAGRMTEARRTATAALRLAVGQGRTEVARSIRGHLERYVQGKDLHEAAEEFVATLADDLRNLQQTPDDAGRHHRVAVALAHRGQFDRAVAHFFMALRLRPHDRELTHDAGLVFIRKGQIDTAIKYYRGALVHFPDSNELANNLAWLLATHPESKLRESTEAVRLMEAACARTGHADPEMLETLAAAYASAGSFGKALTTIDQALDLISPESDDIRLAMLHRKQLYEAGKPFREGTPTER